MYDAAKFLPSGDCAVIMEFGDEISSRVNNRVREVAYILEKQQINGILEWVPTYCSLLILYDPSVISHARLLEKLREVEARKGDREISPPLVTEIPTVYGGQYGPDLEYVAGYNDLSVEEVINIHSGKEYLIYMLGFTPGFPYLGGMSRRIATPRLENPREIISAGSVGIAGEQTGIYPIASPGGWRLIGKTPVSLFEPSKKEPFLLAPGNYLRFVPIDIQEYEAIEQQIKQGIYQIKRYPIQSEGDNNGT